jgi:hypothetical protein
MAYQTPTNRSTGDIISAAIWNQDVVANMIAMTPHGFSAVIDGGGGAITAGIKFDINVPAKCVLTSIRLLQDQSGSIVVDMWKDVIGNFAPTAADSICSASKPTISGSATPYVDSTLSSWTKEWAKDDVIRVNVDSCTTITRVTLAGDVSYN